MSVRRAPRHRHAASARTGRDALALAIKTRDFERAALLLLLDLARAAREGTIDDLIAAIAREEAQRDKHARR